MAKEEQKHVKNKKCYKCNIPLYMGVCVYCYRKYLENSQIDCPTEYSKILKDNFFDLLA